ncbi:hypothetical protein E8E14_006927 [Neopestalotiopsis sp. 37M]|nr:hypothetical protein E8E14_006927 [Neopestalotiopsis sp. 37M]
MVLHGAIVIITTQPVSTQSCQCMPDLVPANSRATAWAALREYVPRGSPLISAVVFAGVIVVIAKKPTLQGSELVSFSQMVRGSASS